MPVPLPTAALAPSAPPHAGPALAAPPRVPLAPVLSAASFSRRGAAIALPSVLEAGSARLVTSGRIALALALRALGVTAGDAVLLPAYHSLSMVPPVLWRGATPLFYRVGMDTAVDLDDVAARLDARAKVLVVTHYFGFAQDLARIRTFCDAHGLALVEDCAHAFFGEHGGRPLGSAGDYAIASSMKFFPSYDGGALVSSRHPLDAVLRSAGAGFEIKAALNTLERAFAYGRLPLLRALLAPALLARDALWPRLKGRRPAAAGAALAPASSDSGTDFDPSWLDKRASWSARSLLRLLPAARIVARRRRNYAVLEQVLAGLPGCRPLFARLPPGTCPWLFPLLVDDPEPVFARLCAAGVPVTRFASTLWPGVDAGSCAASARLSRHVLALPLHQELRAPELAWLAAQAREALSA